MNLVFFFAGLLRPRAGATQSADALITDDDLSLYVQGQLRPLRDQEYQMKKKTLGILIDQKTAGGG